MTLKTFKLLKKLSHKDTDLKVVQLLEIQRLSAKLKYIESMFHYENQVMLDRFHSEIDDNG